jgi:hypothetical protein
METLMLDPTNLIDEIENPKRDVWVGFRQDPYKDELFRLQLTSAPMPRTAVNLKAVYGVSTSKMHPVHMYSVLNEPLSGVPFTREMAQELCDLLAEAGFTPKDPS